jgi:hypothetical protein
MIVDVIIWQLIFNIPETATGFEAMASPLIRL